MRTLVLMVAFGLGTALLLPRPAHSIDDCKVCDCKQMKAWVNPPDNPLVPRGLIGKDPTDPKKLIPVEHAAVGYVDFPAALLSTAPDPGAPTSQNLKCSLVEYTKTPILDCKYEGVEVPPKSTKYVRVTFANAGDWDHYEVVPFSGVIQHLCKQ
jgi:hypothetical protein